MEMLSPRKQIPRIGIIIGFVQYKIADFERDIKAKENSSKILPIKPANPLIITSFLKSIGIYRISICTILIVK